MYLKRVTSRALSALSGLHSDTRQEKCSSATGVKTQAMMIPQWFILMAKLLIYQIRFQSAPSCAKAGPRKENLFCLGQKNSNLRPDFIHNGPNHKKKTKKKVWPVTEVEPQRASLLKNSKHLFSHPPLVQQQCFASMSVLRYGMINSCLICACESQAPCGVVLSASRSTNAEIKLCSRHFNTA